MVANALWGWLQQWKRNNWQRRGKPIWGAPLWQDIAARLEKLVVKVRHVDAHVLKSRATEEHQNNQQVDQAAKIEVAQVDLDWQGKETEKAKDRCDKATMKLHMLHNQYVLALKGAQLHQHQYYDTTLPLLLDSLQKMEEEMIKALKVILDEYSQITSLVTEEIANVHKEIQTSVEQIDPNSEYNDFIDIHRNLSECQVFNLTVPSTIHLCCL
ncbi:tyrosine-protein kinase Fer [Grus japonensis]|uniref:Tyrosine-protein kinase Fer n=1 Tax=Grus japonensis TaxID=30415 RepID=A0ABC9YF87_GRUJA